MTFLIIAAGILSIGIIFFWWKKNKKQPASNIINKEVVAIFNASRKENLTPDPLFGQAGFPPPLARHEIEESIIRGFYPALSHDFLEYDPQLYLRPKPNYKGNIYIKDHPQELFYIQTNAIGMFNDELPIATKPNVRILYTGASNAQGVCFNSESAANQLKILLTEEHPNCTIEVLNAGCGSYNFYNYLAVLEHNIYLKPDIFIVNAYTGNDFFGGVKFWRYFRGFGPANQEPYNPVIIEEQEELFDLELPGSQLLGLELSQVLYLLNNPEDENMILCCACSITEEILRICNKNNITLVFAIIPGPLTGQPHLMTGTRSKVESIMDLPKVAIEVSDRIADQFIDFLSERNIATCDLRPVFRNTNDVLYYRVDGHINVMGQHLIAKTLLSRVQTIISKGGNF